MNRLLTLMIGIAAMIFWPSNCRAVSDTPTIPLKAVGSVLLKDGTFVGTAFVAGKSRSIFMPAHVAVRDTLVFRPRATDYEFGIESELNWPGLDIAIYRRIAGTQEESFDYGNFDRTLPGDRVLFMAMCGADSLCPRYGRVTAKGIARSKGQNVAFIDIEGAEVVPGNSGSPVFNTSGQVIGMVVQGWEESALKGSQQRTIARAYSIDILRIIEQIIYDVNPGDSTRGSQRQLLLDALTAPLPQQNDDD